jgi:hypothetical protein
LLVAFIPGLLMLATFGLERLESGLERNTVSATDVAEFLEQADADELGTLARDGMPEALDCLHRRRLDRGAEPLRQRARDREKPLRGRARTDKSRIDPIVVAGGELGLPTRAHVFNGMNPEFQETRRANRV